MPAFKNSYKFTLDHKNRVKFPAKLRKYNESTSFDQFIITRGLEGCLFVYPLDEWQRIEEKLKSLSYTQSNNRLFMRMMLYQAIDVVLDKQGRIMLPQNLLEIAKIQKEVLILGALDHIEIWEPKIFEEYIQKSPKKYEDVAEQILL